MSREARIDTYPELKDTLAELTADGKSQTAIAEAMGVSDRGTIAAWQKRPDIKARVQRLIQDRAESILTRTTKRIEAKLNSNANISLENLLKIHRAFAGDKLTVDSGDGTKSLEEIFMQAHDDPEFAAALSTLGIQARADEAADDEPASA